MAKYYDDITEELQAFIAHQQMFFVASAPLNAEGHVNLSPKGLDCFRVLSPKRVAYLDLTGSGNETSAHLHENGRITFMFCAFDARRRFCACLGRGGWCCRSRRSGRRWCRISHCTAGCAKSSWPT